MAGQVERAAGGLKREPRSPRWWLRILRLAGFVGVILGAFATRLIPRAGGWTLARQAAWLSFWSARTFRILNIQVQVSGEPPTAGVLVANHLGYLDILALATVRPFIFVSKADVRRWPLFGSLASMGGTLFVRRDLRSDVSRLNLEMAQRVQAGAVVVVFPEGTSSDGRQVLPFRSSLLAPPAEHHWPVTPAWIGYRTQGGSVEDDVAYWRDMVFVPHFLKLLTLPWIDAQIRFGTAITGAGDRKQLARELHDAVVTLGRSSDPAMPA